MAFASASDPDGDRLNNLAEYSTGGNPTNRNDQGNAPASQVVPAGGGANWFEYVHFEHADKNALGLIYSIEQSPDLVSPAWTSTGIMVVGTGILNAEFNAVTNRIAAESEDSQFLRLRVELQE